MTNSSNWWANKLAGKGAAPQAMPPTGPAPSIPYTPPPQQPNVQISYDPTQDQTTVRAVSARKDDRCPNCASGNYFAPQGTQRMRCYDCGYPITQSGSGVGPVGGSSSSGPAIPAKQPSQSGGFNPGTIVDRIG